MRNCFVLNIRVVVAALLLLFIMGSRSESAISKAISVSDSKFDFGTIRQGERDVVSHQFVLQNDTSSLVKVQRISSSCGCTLAKVTSMEIPAHGTLTLDASINLIGIEGIKDSVVLVEFSDKSYLELRLAVKVLVSSRVVPSEGKFEFTKGKENRFEFKIYKSKAGSDDDLGKPELTSDLKDMTLECKSVDMPGANQKTTNRYEWVVYSVEGCLPKECDSDIAGYVYIKMADGERIVMPVSFVYKHPIFCQQNPVFCGNVKRGVVTRHSIKVCGIGGGAIGSVSSDNPDVSLSVTGTENTAINLEAQVRWPNKSGFHRFDGSFIIGVDQNHRVPFALVGIVKGGE